MKLHLKSIIASMLLINVGLYAVDPKPANSELNQKIEPITTNIVQTPLVDVKQQALNNVLVNETNQKIVETFSKINQLDINKISLLSSDSISEFGLTKYVFNVEGYPIKGILFETDKGLFLPTDFLTKDGVNLYQQSFYDVNKEFIDKQSKLKADQEKVQNEQKVNEMKAKAPEVVKYLTSIEEGKLGDVLRTIPGNPSAIESLYLFTDPLCPYCMMYETGKDLKTGKAIDGYGLRADLEKYKEVKVVMYPLYNLQGHDTAIKRSFWFNENSKNITDKETLLNLLHKASNAKIEEIIVDEEKFKVYNAFVRNTENGLQTNNVIQGTPSMFTRNGFDPRVK